jgi:hypothetical protein
VREEIEDRKHDSLLTLATANTWGSVLNSHLERGLLLTPKVRAPEKVKCFLFGTA